MGLPDYECADDLPDRLPDLLKPMGVSCTKLAGTGAGPCGGGVRYRLTRGWGTVEFVGLGRPPGRRYHFWLVCGRRPLYWLWDLRLLRLVERALFEAGAELSTTDRGV